MSAEVSFTKRAAAELSRCFNGLSTTVARSNSSTSSHSSASSATSGHGTSGSLSSAGQSEPSRSSSWKRKSNSSGHQQHLNGDGHDHIEIVNGHHESGNSKSDSTKREVPSKLEPSRIEQFKGLFNQDKKDKDHTNDRKCRKELDNDKKRRNSSAVTSKDGTKDKIGSRKASYNTGDSKINNVIRLFSNHKPNEVKLSSIHGHDHSMVDKRGTTGTISTPGTPQFNRVGSISKPAPAPPRKTSLARCKNFLIGLNKPRTVKELFQNQEFLINLFKSYFNVKDRSTLAQVCSFWRDILYNDTSIWKDVTFVINCSELRRLSTSSAADQVPSSSFNKQTDSIIDVDTTNKLDPTSCSGINNLITIPLNQSSSEDNDPKKSSSVNESVSIESMDSLLDQSSTFATNDIKSNLYISIEMRGMDKVAFLGVNDADIIHFTTNMPHCTLKRITYLSLRSTSVTDKGLKAILASVNNSLLQLELSGCNEVTDSGSWVSLVPKIQTLSILDCINIADETVQNINQSMVHLKELNLQAYHVTDASMSYFGSPSTVLKNLTKVHLEHCWELSNQGITTLAHNLSTQLTSLSIAGCSKVTDDAIEIIAEKCRNLESLNLSWCSRISDASLEFIACDLSESIQFLFLDRCIHITDIGLGFISTMARLKSLSVRWCPQVRDFGLQTICSMRTLESISVAGCPQLSVNGLSCLVQMQHLKEIELTNCPGATPELVKYLEEHLPVTTSVVC